MRACRRLHAERAVDAARAVLDGYRLRAARLLIQLDPANARQQISDLAVDQVAAIELGGDLHRKPQLSPGGFHAAPVGDGSGKSAAETDKRVYVPREHFLASLDGVQAFLSRRLKAELLLQLVERHQL